MTLLIIITLVLLAIAAHQLMRINELSRDMRKDAEFTPTEKDNRMHGKLMLAFLFAFFTFVIVETVIYGPKGLPKPASEHGVNVDWLMNLNLWIVYAVFFLTNAVLFYFAYKYYGRKGAQVRFIAHDNKLEMEWTIIPAIVLAFIIIFGLKNWNDIMAKSQKWNEVTKQYEGKTPLTLANAGTLTKENADKFVVNIELYSKQFDWTARYCGEDGKFGIDDYRMIDGSNPIGLDTTDANCFDDLIIKDEFHLPKGVEANFQFRSRDVIHSAFMPHFRAQMNCVPGQVTFFHYTPTITTSEMRKDADVVKHVAEINEIKKAKGEDPYEFNFMLVCNKICGASHYNMPMRIVIDEPADYVKWLAEQQKKQFKGSKLAKAPEAKPEAPVDTNAFKVDTAAAKTVAVVDKKK